jgi:hypothetical protein
MSFHYGAAQSEETDMQAEVLARAALNDWEYTEERLCDNKGFSEEACVRCGWTMGQPALNCQNEDTPHVFPSQQALIAELEKERDEYLSQRNLDYKRFSEAKQALIAAALALKEQAWDDPSEDLEDKP